jgi:hypothetical protein
LRHCRNQLNIRWVEPALTLKHRLNRESKFTLLEEFHSLKNKIKDFMLNETKF